MRQILNVARKVVQHYRAKARRVIWDLRESSTGEKTFRNAVATALHQTVEGRGIACELTVTGAETDLSKEVEHNLLRVCQEALSNAVRHGMPQRVCICLQYADTSVTMRVEDDGGGFDPEAICAFNNGHFGLTIMQERMRRFGGTLILKSAPGKGAVIEATVPICRGK